MKTFVTLILLCVFSTQAFAGFNGRKDLDKEIVEDIKGMDKLRDFRVYLNKQITITFVETEKVKTEIITSEVKGKIILDETKYIEEYKKNRYGNYGTGPSERHYVYVSFDKRCQRKECALTFLDNEGKYELTQVPQEGAQIKYGTFGFEEKKTYLTFKSTELEEITRTKHYAPGFD